MRLRLEATSDEFHEKGPALLEALADRLGIDLSKALPPPEPQLKYPVLQEMLVRTTKLFEQQMKAMDAEIQAVIAQKLKKGGSNENHALVSGSGGSRDRGGNMVPVSRTDLAKADFTKPIADKDEVAYTRMKTLLLQRGYSESDFLEGGKLYGWSTNQLRDLLKEQ